MKMHLAAYDHAASAQDYSVSVSSCKNSMTFDAQTGLAVCVFLFAAGAAFMSSFIFASILISIITIAIISLAIKAREYEALKKQKNLLIFNG